MLGNKCRFLEVGITPRHGRRKELLDIGYYLEILGFEKLISSEG
jgi:hypothetical protein